MYQVMDENDNIFIQNSIDNHIFDEHNVIYSNFIETLPCA